MTVTALVPWFTVEDAVRRGEDLGVRVCVDLFNVSDPVATARRAERTGAGAVMVHVGVDQRRHDPHYSQLNELRQVAGSLSIPVAYATYDVDEAVAAVAAGASEIVQGTPLIEADDPEPRWRRSSPWSRVRTQKQRPETRSHPIGRLDRVLRATGSW